MPTILAVEDDQFLRQIYHRIFAPDYHVITASDGQEGFETYATDHNDINLIITDCQMPRMSGITFLENLHRSYENLPPRLMIAGGHDKSIHAHVQSLGGLGLYNKPFDRTEIKTIVDEILHDKTSPTLETYFSKNY
jgi:CheY-like chemotaxis protein